MDEEILRSALNRLELDHIKILYWLSRNRNNKYIAPRLKKNSTDVHFMRKFIETTLKIAGVEDVDDSARRYPPEIIQLINETVGTPPDWSKWPPPFLKPESESSSGSSQFHEQELALSQEEDELTEPENESIEENNSIAESENLPEGIRRFPFPVEFSWRNAGVAALVIALLFGAVLIGRLFRSGRGPTNIANTPDLQEVAQEATEAQTGNAGNMPSITPTITLDGTMTQAAINLHTTEDAMTAVAATETARVTDTPTVTPTPSFTPTLAPTPTPSSTPTATPVILFSDDFTGGKSDQWIEEYGDVTVVNDSLVFNKESLIVVGDIGWTDYVVSFDARNLYCWRAMRSTDMAIWVRYQDQRNNVRLRVSDWNNCGGQWFKVINNQSTHVNGADFPLWDPNDGVTHFEITVQGNSYSVVNGSTIILDDLPLSGKVGIRADGGIVIDNFRVEMIEPTG